MQQPLTGLPAAPCCIPLHTVPIWFPSRASVARQHLPGTEVPPTCSWGCRQMAGAAGARDDVHPEASLRPAFPLALCRARPCPGSSGPPADPTPFSEVLGTVLWQHSAPGARPLSSGATTETPLAEDKLVEGQQPPRGRRRGSGGKVEYEFVGRPPPQASSLVHSDPPLLFHTCPQTLPMNRLLVSAWRSPLRGGAQRGQLAVGGGPGPGTWQEVSDAGRFCTKC